MGQDLCPDGEVKAGGGLIWGYPLTDRATTDTGGASEVLRKGEAAGLWQTDRDLHRRLGLEPCAPQIGICPHQGAQGLRLEHAGKTAKLGRGQAAV